MDNEDHDEEGNPSGEGASATTEAAVVEKHTDRHRPEHLRCPINKAIQRTSAYVE